MMNFKNGHEKTQIELESDSSDEYIHYFKETQAKEFFHKKSYFKENF